VKPKGVGVENGHRTPEEAALAGFPPGLARVVRIRTATQSSECAVALGDDEVEVELATNEPPYEYAYFVHVALHDERWFEGNSHN
jgi:hypothetical protein